MTEPEKAKIKVNKPTAYEQVPLPRAAGNGSGTGKDGSPFYDAEVYERAPAPKPPPFKGPIEDDKNPSGPLIEAVRTVFKAVTGQIAFHESEAQRLRNALAPFASLARQSATPDPPSDDADVGALLALADQFKRQMGE